MIKEEVSGLVLPFLSSLEALRTSFLSLKVGVDCVERNSRKLLQFLELCLSILQDSWLAMKQKKG